MVAIFVCGLKSDARVWRKLSGGKDFDRELMTAMYDCLKMLVWLNSSDGQEGVNRPKSLYETLFGNKKEEESDAMEFETPEDFRREWERMNNGNNS
jgi:hypothetical protein